jgi:hypothetical protein
LKQQNFFPQKKWSLPYQIRRPFTSVPANIVKLIEKSLSQNFHRKLIYPMSKIQNTSLAGMSLSAKILMK